MTAINRKGLEQQRTNSDRQSMASQTQDKSRRASSMSYEASDQGSGASLRYSSVNGATTERTSRVAQPAAETYHRRPELMGVRRKRSGSEFREDHPEGFGVGQDDDEARKAIALDAGKKHLSDSEILADLCCWIEKSAGGSKGARWAHSFAQASSYPPITKHSLSELDIGAIINNPKLRHDVNFDRELHFRPNFDGAKGKFKLKTAEEYWNALTAELELYTFLFSGAATLSCKQGASWSRIVQIAQRRIPLMFDTIREIIKSLVPERDQGRVDEQLDTKMIVQQIEKGVCDLPSVARWLSHLLKAHCAPVRDEWVDKMVQQIDNGAQNGSGRSLVNGLRELLGILEAMKLDVANHQIRHLRALLIEDTVNFEQKYHLDRISRRRILVERSQCWFAQHAITSRSIAADRKAKDRGLRVIVRGVLSLLTSSDRQGSFPETFYLDFDRLRVLRAEFRDQVYLGVCVDTYKSLLRSLGFNGSISGPIQQALREAVSAIVAVNEVTGSNNNQHWLVNVDNIAVELVRQALAQCGSDSDYDGELVEITVTRLKELIRPDFGMVFHEQASKLREALTARVLRATESFVNSSPVDIFNALITQSGACISRTAHQDDTDTPEAEYVDDIARRTTHIAVLHWRIWGPIAYSQTAAFVALSQAAPSDASADASWSHDGSAESPEPEQCARRWSSAGERRAPASAASIATDAGGAVAAPAASQASAAEQSESSDATSASGLPPLVYRQR